MKHLILALGMMIGSFTHAASSDYDNVSSSAKPGVQAAVEYAASEFGHTPEYIKDNFTLSYRYEFSYELQPLLIYLQSPTEYCSFRIEEELYGYCGNHDY